MAKKGYWVGCYRRVTDAKALESYSALAGPAIEAAGGRFLSRGIAVEAHEAGVVERTVIVEFDSLRQAKTAYVTEAYRKAIQAMEGKVERDFRILEGI